MAQSDDRTPNQQLEEEARAVSFRRLEETVRGIAHDLNGALNNLALNVELIDAATAGGSDDAADAASRARSLANLRRAVREIQSIVEQRLLPLGRPGEPGRTLER